MPDLGRSMESEVWMRYHKMTDNDKMLEKKRRRTEPKNFGERELFFRISVYQNRNPINKKADRLLKRSVK
jgi:hypothetical protein